MKMLAVDAGDTTMTVLMYAQRQTSVIATNSDILI